MLIRWLSTSQDYQFSNSRVRVSEKDTRVLAVTLFPVSVKGVERFTRTNGGEVSAGTASFEGIFNQTGDVSMAKMSRQRAELPVLFLVGQNGHLQPLNAVREGVKTGLINGTSAAVVAGLLLGGAAAAISGSLFGFGTGISQAIHTNHANELRTFARECDRFLQVARRDGLTADAVRILRSCALRARTSQQVQLVKDIIEVCRVCLGDEQSKSVRDLAALLSNNQSNATTPAQKQNSVRPSSGTASASSAPPAASKASESKAANVASSSRLTLDEIAKREAQKEEASKSVTSEEVVSPKPSEPLQPPKQRKSFYSSSNSYSSTARSDFYARDHSPAAAFAFSGGWGGR